MPEAESDNSIQYGLFCKVITLIGSIQGLLKYPLHVFFEGTQCFFITQGCERNVWPACQLVVAD